MLKRSDVSRWWHSPFKTNIYKEYQTSNPYASSYPPPPLPLPRPSFLPKISFLFPFLFPLFPFSDTQQINTFVNTGGKKNSCCLYRSLWHDTNRIDTNSIDTLTCIQWAQRKKSRNIFRHLARAEHSTVFFSSSSHHSGETKDPLYDKEGGDCVPDERAEPAPKFWMGVKRKGPLKLFSCAARPQSDICRA